MVVVLPDHPKLYHTLRDGGDLEGGLVFGVFLEEGRVLEGGDEFCWANRQRMNCMMQKVGWIMGAYLCTPARTPALMEGWTWLVYV